MSDSNAGAIVPSAWAAYGPIVAGLLRAVLAALGAAGFTWAQAVTGSEIEMAAGVALMLAAAGWSAYQKIAAARVARRLALASAAASAEASAAAGQPIVIPPSPPGTTAADLNRAELERIRQGGRP